MNLAKLRAPRNRGKLAVILELPARDVDLRPNTGLLELKSVRNQVLQQLAKLRRVAFNRRQWCDGNFRVRGRDRHFQVLENAANDLIQVAFLERKRARGDAG